MIICKICNEEFETVISWKHLKKHDLTVPEYKKLYGEKSTISPEYSKRLGDSRIGEKNSNYGNRWSDEQKQHLSKQRIGTPAWNRGIACSEEHKKILSQKAIERNEKWRETNSHPSLGKKHSEETREKIKEKRKLQVIKKESVKKAIETKRANGYDLAFFKGKKHKPESIEKISHSAKKTALRKHLSFIERLKIILKERKVSIESINKPYINLKCDNCNHTFTFISAYVKARNDLCPVCFPRISGFSHSEREINDWIINQGFSTRANSRSIITPLELDIYIPEKKLAIEYCGLYWHSEIAGKDKKYHLNKQLLCNKQGITLITIFEDEWILTPEIVKSRLKSLLGITSDKIHARQCIIKEIPVKTCNDFLKENHLQGSGRSNVKLGAFFNDKLVAVMTFNKSNISRKNTTEWEIDRFCSEKNTSVIGIASKLLKYFIKHNNPETILTYADRRWSNESFYESIGFKFEKYTEPNYWYFFAPNVKRYNVHSLRKNKQDIPELSEWENRQIQGWNRIWDCGNIKYKWARK